MLLLLLVVGYLMAMILEIVIVAIRNVLLLVLVFATSPGIANNVSAFCLPLQINFV